LKPAEDMQDDPCLLIQTLEFCLQGKDEWDFKQDQVVRLFPQKVQLDACLRTSH